MLQIEANAGAGSPAAVHRPLDTESGDHAGPLLGVVRGRGVCKDVAVVPHAVHVERAFALRCVGARRSFPPTDVLALPLANQHLVRGIRTYLELAEELILLALAVVDICQVVKASVNDSGG